MAIIKDYDIPLLPYFKFGNIFSGSHQERQFKIKLVDDHFMAYVWFDIYCFEFASDIREKRFEITDTVLEDIVDWIDRVKEFEPSL